MILLKFLILLALIIPGYSKTKRSLHNQTISKKEVPRKVASNGKKQEYLQYLKKTCEFSQKNKVLREKSRNCSCFAKKMSELNEKELRHLTLASLGQGKYSELSIEDG